MLPGDLSRSSSTEKFLSQNTRYDTKICTELVTKYLMKFEKEIAGYFPSLDKDEFAYIRNPFTANAQMQQNEQVLRRNRLNFIMILHTMCILRNIYVNFWPMMCNSYTKLLHMLFKYCCCFYHHGYVDRHFQCWWKLNQN